MTEDLDIKILEVYEQNEILRVKTECIYGKDNIGLKPDKKYLDTETGKPKYLKAIKHLLSKKYGPMMGVKKEVEEAKEFKGKVFKLSEIDKGKGKNGEILL